MAGEPPPSPVSVPFPSPPSPRPLDGLEPLAVTGSTVVVAGSSAVVAGSGPAADSPGVPTLSSAGASILVFCLPRVGRTLPSLCRTGLSPRRPTSPSSSPPDRRRWLPDCPLAPAPPPVVGSSAAAAIAAGWPPSAMGRSAATAALPTASALSAPTTKSPCWVSALPMSPVLWPRLPAPLALPTWSLLTPR
ncbi:hypothetical protein GUJ93_ZPchr0013g36997 [Zizania palustris]|uniref:Uncharacterized protein n=1 Tax=Zizania palustris TaxID=103762 RepID=A0A8J6BWG7_ZIZPA|nr:hypothetical protein GUJ93_ZPchr0013g36997 [Zizania palustris]